MERGNTKHGPVKDDNLKQETEGMVRGTGPTHAEEWRDPEPLTDDDESDAESAATTRQRPNPAGE